MMGIGSQKVRKAPINEDNHRFIGERKPNDRYDVRSRDCHATDAHMSYESSPMELVGVHPT